MPFDDISAADERRRISAYNENHNSKIKIMSESDFFNGVFAALINSGELKELTPEPGRLSFAFKESYEHLRRNSERWEVNPRFTVSLDAQGVSPVVERGLAGALRLQIIGADFPYMTTIFPESTSGVCTRFIQRLPGTPEMYKELAEAFRRGYENFAFQAKHSKS